MRFYVTALLAAFTVLAYSTGASGELWKALRDQSAEEAARGETDFWTRTLGLDAAQSASFYKVTLLYATSSSLTVKLGADDAYTLSTLDRIESEKAHKIADLLRPRQRDRYLAAVERMKRLREGEDR